MLLERRPYRKRQRCHHRDHRDLLEHHPDEGHQIHRLHRHLRHQNRDAVLRRRNLGAELRRHQPDVDHQDDQDHRHQPGEDHQDDQRRPDLGDPYPAKEQMGCCQGEPSDEECPCLG